MFAGMGIGLEWDWNFCEWEGMGKLRAIPAHL